MEQRFETFTALVIGISRAIRKIKSEEMAEFHLKSPHVSCLYYLYKQRELTAKALCDLCDEDKANMSRIIDFLERNGYVLCATQSRPWPRSSPCRPSSPCSWAPAATPAPSLLSPSSAA